MMKFILMGVLGVSCIMFSGVSFWLVGGLVVLMYILFTMNGLVLLDQYILGPGLSMDLVSFSLVELSLLICVLMYFSSNSVFSGHSASGFFVLVYSLMLILIFTFLVSNMLSFYFFFEASLIPTLLIIMGWGYQPERLQAGVYFLFYTLGASLPLLVLIIYLYGRGGSAGMFVGAEGLKFLSFSFIMFIFSTLAFMVKMPMFFTHLWLPKAHVEAPVSGSMILAGVLLKLGGYGIYRVVALSGEGVMIYGGYYFGLSVLGMVYVGLMCLRLSDMKALVAYSSVAHMGMVICGLMSFYYWGFNGALVMMIAHGVGSSGLFCAVNIYYERSGSRAFYMNKGLISILPVFTLWFFMLCGANMAAPPTMNLLSEIFLMGSLMKFDLLMLLVFPVGSYLGALFTLFLFSYTQHGKFYEGLHTGASTNFREYFLMGAHLFPLNILVLKPEFFMSMF